MPLSVEYTTACMREVGVGFVRRSLITSVLTQAW